MVNQQILLIAINKKIVFKKINFKIKEIIMPDGKKIRHPHDRKQININQPYEVGYWTELFKVSEEELINAVKKVRKSAIRKFDKPYGPNRSINGR